MLSRREGPLIWICATALAADWTDHIDRTLDAVVSISMAKTRSFDGNSAGTSQATGWVVDAERGLVMTNRHVATTGPTVHRATFYDEEEADLTVVYRDPVHDFAILQYDPTELVHADPPSLELAVDGAEVGDLIWTAGNDSGEKVVIHESTLARKDRGPPGYDANTFYWQAATDVAGGGSGSPVLNAEGKVVALHSGGARGEQSSFHLPLDRIARALELVQAGEPVTRGTLQVTWTYTSYAEAKDLGLTEADEAAFRETFPDRRGVLVAGTVVPGGPGHGAIRPGDVLLAVEGERLSSYFELAAHLDDHAGGEVTLSVQRRSRTLELEVGVSDLHELVPHAYIEFDGNIVHTFGWSWARKAPRPTGGLVWAFRGVRARAGGLPSFAYIREIDGREVTTLAELEALLGEIPAGSYVTVTYEEWDEVGEVETTTVSWDAVWKLRRYCEERVGEGWSCRPLAPAPAPVAGAGAVTRPKQPQRRARRAAEFLVEVESWALGPAVGDLKKFTGMGILADTEEGLVLVDRSTVPGPHATVELVFASRLRIPAEVVWVDPNHDLAWLRYDPAAIGDTAVATPTFRSERYEQRDRVWQVVGTGDMVAAKKTRVVGMGVPGVPEPSPPRFQEQGVEVVGLQDSLPGTGVLTDRRGRITALWTGLIYDGGKKNSVRMTGLSVELVEPQLEALRSGALPSSRTHGLVLRALSLEQATKHGVDPDHLELVAKARRPAFVLMVRRRTPGSPAWEVLEDGDILLTLAGEPLVWALDLEAAVREGPVEVEVLRDGEVRSVRVEPFERAAASPYRLVDWAGMVLHEPHPEVELWAGRELSGVYVSRYWYGGPNQLARMKAAQLVFEVDEQPVASLDDLLAVIGEVEDREVVTLRSIRLSDLEELSYSLRMDLTHFPTRELVYEDGAWVER